MLLSSLLLLLSLASTVVAAPLGPVYGGGLGPPWLGTGPHPGDPLINVTQPVLVARADAVSPPYATPVVRVQFDFVGFFGRRGTYVSVNASSGLNANDSSLGSGVFFYHVHTSPIPVDGNCTEAWSRLDPYNVTEGNVCDPAFPAYCQEGDLSGKHGALNGSETGAIDAFAFEDDYLRWFPNEFSLLGRSVVVETQNGTRIACGNISAPVDDTATWNLVRTNVSSSYNPPATLPNVSALEYGPPITPINGTVFPSDEELSALPYPWPNPALPIFEAPNVELVELDNVLGEPRPAAVYSSDPPPFARIWKCTGDCAL